MDEEGSVAKKVICVSESHVQGRHTVSLVIENGLYMTELVLK